MKRARAALAPELDNVEADAVADEERALTEIARRRDAVAGAGPA